MFSGQSQLLSGILALCRFTQRTTQTFCFPCQALSAEFCPSAARQMRNSLTKMVFGTCRYFYLEKLKNQMMFSIVFFLSFLRMKLQKKGLLNAFCVLRMKQWLVSTTEFDRFVIKVFRRLILSIMVVMNLESVRFSWHLALQPSPRLSISGTLLWLAWWHTSERQLSTLR